MRWFARAQQIDAPRPVEAVSGGDRAATEDQDGKRPAKTNEAATD